MISLVVHLAAVRVYLSALPPINCTDKIKNTTQHNTTHTQHIPKCPGTRTVWKSHNVALVLHCVETFREHDNAKTWDAVGLGDLHSSYTGIYWFYLSMYLFPLLLPSFFHCLLSPPCHVCLCIFPFCSRWLFSFLLWYKIIYLFIYFLHAF
jgi:hypothetical protein